MKICTLNLSAFGPFTDQTLQFGAETGGLHIVFGPNEAGKSSALRGLKSLLYGIPERTTDNFVHANDALRIGGCLRGANGQELSITRRKGRKNTLLSSDDEPLDGAALTPFLPGVTPELFETLFGIDHNALVRGGQEILEQRGEVGQALFAAALGSQSLHAVLEQLDNEADDLFKPRGSTQKITSALKAYTEQSKAVRDRSLSSRDWDQHRRALAGTTKALQQVQDQLAHTRAEVNRLKRIQRILPKLARRRELKTEFEALADVIMLPDDFGERRQKATRELETAQAIIRQATARRTDLQGELQGLTVRDGMLERGERIEALHARLGGHLKAKKDRPQLEAERNLLRADADALLKDIRPGLVLADAERLRPVFSRRQRITELGHQSQALVARAKQVENGQREIETRLAEIRDERWQLTDTGSPKELKKAIAAARRSGDLDTMVESARREAQRLEDECETNLAGLTLWNGGIDDARSLPAPARESVNRFEEEFQELDRRVQRLQERRGESADALHDASRRLDEIQRTGAAPTEEHLSALRSERDHAWRLLRRHWIDGGDVSSDAAALDPERTLPDAFEHRVVQADEVADRLRREADRVQKQASLIAAQEDAKRRMADIARQLKQCAEEKTQLDAAWGARWADCGIRPHAPREMREWLDKLEKLQERSEQFAADRRQLDGLEQSRDRHIQALAQCLRALGASGDHVADAKSLEPVLVRSEETVAEIEEAQRRREGLDDEFKTLERKLDSLRTDLRQAFGELGDWKARWKTEVEDLGLGGDALPSEAADVIERLRAMFEKLGEMEKLRIRIEGIDRDSEAFREEVAAMAEQVAPEYADLPAEDTAVRLNKLLSESRSRETRRRQIEEQVQQATRDIQNSDATIQTMTERLDALCGEARCDKHAELENAERRSIEYFQRKQGLNAVEQEILEAGEGAALAELEAEAGEIDSDTLPGRIEALTRNIDEILEPRSTELAETKGREEKELELMDGRDDAAALADEAQAVLAGIRSHAERYVRVKLAARILRDEIERYRKENQGPLVKRASEHFAALTRDSFQGLRTDFNEKDEPVLVGIRPSGERVHVQGMSSGTRDQLYLALRLASLEKYMETSEPMPFIVDDVLVDFDDERSGAALKALSELARKTQVIVFTHHRRVADQARALDGAAQVHEL